MKMPHVVMSKSRVRECDESWQSLVGDAENAGFLQRINQGLNPSKFIVLFQSSVSFCELLSFSPKVESYCSFCCLQWHMGESQDLFRKGDEPDPVPSYGCAPLK